MFQDDSRIERENGIRFYEQDVLMGDYIFTGDMKLDLESHYLSPGLGIVLSEVNERSRAAESIYVIKFGINDLTVIRKKYERLETMLHVSSFISPPVENLELTIRKTGRNIEIRDKSNLLGSYLLPETLDKYKVGFYSNQGNTLVRASMASGIPKGWDANIKNTNGGRVIFFRDGFSIEGCEKDSEVEQGKVFLKKGYYFLDYIKDTIKGEGDIESFVFLHDDKRFDDKEKNILKNRNRFYLEKDSYVNIKFKGTVGSISNISIKENPYDSYVPTYNTAVESNGSVIVVNLEGLSSVRWTGIIDSVPQYEDLLKEREYSLIKTNEKRYLPDELHIELGEEYEYFLDIKNKTLKIKGKEDVNISIKEDDKKLWIWESVSGVITELIIKKSNGEEINILLQKTNRIYVPGAIKGPIVITDRFNTPMDISSSYRIEKNKRDKYIFTNWEREIFKKGEKMALEKAIIDAPGNIRIYGIKQGVRTDIENIFLTTEGIDNIDKYCEQYEILKEIDDFEIDYYMNEILLRDKTKEAYDSYVIDYLKNNSYCVNYIDELDSYEVDISTKEESMFVIYDYFEDEDGQGSINEYMLTDIEPEINKSKYVVLRKD